MAINELTKHFTVKEPLDAASKATFKNKTKLISSKVTHNSVFTARANQEAIVARSLKEKLKRLKERREGAAPIDDHYILVEEPRIQLLGSIEDLEKVVKVILTNGGEAHKDTLLDTDYRVTRSDFKTRLMPALIRDCGVVALSSGMLANRTTGVNIKIRGWGNHILMKVSQSRV